MAASACLHLVCTAIRHVLSPATPNSVPSVQLLQWDCVLGTPVAHPGCRAGGIRGLPEQKNCPAANIHLVP